MPVVTKNHNGQAISNANDLIYGTLTPDLIDGRGGDDIIYGRAGGDAIIGNRGNDVLKGGSGDDRFYFGLDHDFDTVVDFGRTINGIDSIALEANIDRYAVADDPLRGGILITTTDLNHLGTGTTKTGAILLAGVSAATWTAMGGTLGSNFTADMWNVPVVYKYAPLIDLRSPPPGFVSVEQVFPRPSLFFEEGSNTNPSLSADGRYVAFERRVGPDPILNFETDIFVYDRQTGTNERVSVDNNGTPGGAASFAPSISANGRFVTYSSFASNLVAGDTNGRADIFVYDRQTDTVERVSVAGSGTQANGSSSAPSISANGRYVTFHSNASNLVAGDTNGKVDTFVYDRLTDAVERISVTSNGAQGNGISFAPSISSDGRYVTFKSSASNLVAGDTNGRADIFVYDRQMDTVERVSVASSGAQANGTSFAPSISADGRYVTYSSFASNLVAGDTNGKADIFVYDRQTDTIERISVAGSGVQANGSSSAPTISANGRYVTFQSNASNLVAGDNNGVADVFVYDRLTDTTARVSVAGDYGFERNGPSVTPTISANGQYVAYSSDTSESDGVSYYDTFVIRRDDFLV